MEVFNFGVGIEVLVVIISIMVVGKEAQWVAFFNTVTVFVWVMGIKTV